MHVMALFLFLFVIGCGAQPAPHMMGAKRYEVQRGGFTFVVFKKGLWVEVVRLGWARPGQHQAIRAMMVDVIPEVTGCTIIPASLTGDSGEMRGELHCRSP